MLTGELSGRLKQKSRYKAAPKDTMGKYIDPDTQRIRRIREGMAKNP
jgi:hypothetical protein